MAEATITSIIENTGVTNDRSGHALLDDITGVEFETPTPLTLTPVYIHRCKFWWSLKHQHHTKSPILVWRGAEWCKFYTNTTALVFSTKKIQYLEFRPITRKNCHS